MTYAGNINGFLFVAQVGCAFLQFVYLKRLAFAEKVCIMRSGSDRLPQ